MIRVSKQKEGEIMSARRYLLPLLALLGLAACKTTGMPADSICSRALMRVAWAARAARR